MNIKWFKENIAAQMTNYDLSYHFFENGDFGDLNQVRFESEKMNMGGEIDFWSSGFIYILLFDYTIEKDLMNIFLEPQELIQQGDIVSVFLSHLRN